MTTYDAGEYDGSMTLDAMVDEDAAEYIALADLWAEEYLGNQE